MTWPAKSAVSLGLAAGALLLLLGLAAPSAARAQAAPQAWTNDQSMFLFYQAFLKIQEEGLVRQSGGEIVRQALKSYLEGLDPYSTYLTPEEYEAHKTSSKAEYSGVGMDAYRRPDGELVCLPHPGSPAERAGVKTGELLVGVNGKPVAGLSLVAVGNLVRGPMGSTVTLGLQTPDGKRRAVPIKRRPVDNAAVSLSRKPGVLLARVLRFDNSTVRLLRQALSEARPGENLVIDLRSCRGGSLFAGVDAADMLLPIGKTIVTLRRRDGSKTYPSRQAPLKLAGPLFVWQDRYTASSAELMIAALVQNGAARSVGTVSFGKATTQKVFPLQDGSALVLTDGRLLAPDGHTWNRKGLSPSLPLAGDNPGLSEYLARTAAPGKAARATPKPKAVPPAPPPPAPAAKSTANADPRAKLLARVEAAGAALDTRYYVCFDTPHAGREAAREQAKPFAGKIPPELIFTPVASELVSPLEGKFFSCLPPLLTRGQAQERLRVLDRKGVGVLGIREGRAPQAAPAARPPTPNPEDWFIQVNKFNEVGHALNDAKRLAGKGYPVMLMITVPSPQHQARVAAWLKDNRLAGEIYLCPQQAASCWVSYSVLAGPYYAQAEGPRQDLLGLWPGAFWLQRRDLASRY
ncbi:MAG: PDZ domain-containing protein [Desulfarculus sp.]|nr:PDZ domain-containing protein [Pseudomonadota bacterium]MBV1714932.1 PDZ domain-containing protein [Desulfarculus sp.]MBU4576699.1 PDZ domain-containing protein [Pseudomonadota bacterium]MBU4599015.1 PDZ domain-containing protein [Pseudomonadota bacterium]MBV1737432.1 PDZ domain-containing protein [Desulfarculus sp.]